MIPGLDLYHAHPAKPLTTAGEELDDLYHNISDLSVHDLSVHDLSVHDLSVRGVDFPPPEVSKILRYWLG